MGGYFAPESFDMFNSIVACSSVILLTIDLTAYAVRRLLGVAHNTKDLYFLCPVALAIGTISFHFCAIPYFTLSWQGKAEFLCVLSVCIIGFCVSLSCRRMTRANVEQMKDAAAHFDNFTTTLNFTSPVE